MTDETIGNVPILLLGNKIDRPEAISEEKLRELFGLYGQTTGKVGRCLSSLLGQFIVLITNLIVNQSPEQTKDHIKSLYLNVVLRAFLVFISTH